MTLMELRVLWRLGRLHAEDIPDRAVELMQSGLEHEWIVELAGLDRPTMSEAEPLLLRVFEAFGIPDLDREEAAVAYAAGIAARVVAGEVTPRAAVDEIAWLANLTDYPKALMPIYALADEYQSEFGRPDADVDREARVLLEQLRGAGTP